MFLIITFIFQIVRLLGLTTHFCIIGCCLQYIVVRQSNVALVNVCIQFLFLKSCGFRNGTYFHEIVYRLFITSLGHDWVFFRRFPILRNEIGCCYFFNE